MGPSHAQGIAYRPRLPPGEALEIIIKSHVKFSVHWSPRNKQEVIAMVDTRAEYTLIHGNLKSFLAFSVPSVVTEDKLSWSG